MNLPAIGTTILLRQRKEHPYDWNFNNAKPTYNDMIVVVLRITDTEVVVQLKTQPIEAYIPKRFFSTKGCDYTSIPPIIPLPSNFEIITLPL